MTAGFGKIKEFWIDDLKIDIFRNPNGEYFTSSNYKDSDEEAKEEYYKDFDAIYYVYSDDVSEEELKAKIEI